MLKRTISGACYVAILVGFFLLREFVDARLFHLLTYFFAIVGTFELVRALNKERLIKGWFTLSIIYAFLFVPVYYLGEYIIFDGWGWLFALDLVAIMVIVTAITAIIKNIPTQKFLCSILPFVYPSLFLLTMLVANDGKYGFISLLTAFVVSPCSDTFAYLVGSTVGGKKLCPKLSPKKTWSGAIGGTVGGIVGAIIIYFIFKPTVNFFSPVLLFVIAGLVASILNLFGDLFESYIKRKVGIKDMGKIMPGHGGVLDRIDGTMFAIVFLCILFLLV